MINYDNRYCNYSCYFLLIRGKIIKDKNKLRKSTLSLFFYLKNYDIISM